MYISNTLWYSIFMDILVLYNLLRPLAIEYEKQY